MATKIIIAALWRASGQGDCCGANCPIDHSGTTEACPATGGMITAAETMTMETIHAQNYTDEFHASCNSAHSADRANFSVDILTFNCPQSCPAEDFGDILFGECCAACRSHATCWDSNGHRNFTHCQGCPSITNAPAPCDGELPHNPNNETEEEFNTWVLHTMMARLTSTWSVAAMNQTTMGTIDGVTTGAGPVQRLLQTAASPGTAGAQPVQPPATPGAVAAPPAQPAAGAGASMTDTNYGYSTRCGDGHPAPCHGTFSFSLINCADCGGVPILERSCCRDCGCEMDRLSQSSSEFLWCSGCACHTDDTAVGPNQTARVQNYGVQRWLQTFIESCNLVQAPAPPPTPPPPVPAPPAPPPPTQVHVTGQIPLTFDDPNAILNNPTARTSASTAIGGAIANLTGVAASDVAVTLSDAAITARRLMSNSAQATDRRLSGVVNAAFDVTAANQAAATNVESTLSGASAWPQSTILQRIDSWLSAAGIAPATSMGDLTIFHGDSTTVAPAVAAPASGTSGTWAPAVIGVVVALILAAIAAAVCMASSNSKSPKKAGTKRAVKRGGRDESPAPPGDNSTVLTAPPNALQVQPTMSTALPVLAAPTMSAPMSVARPVQPAQAVSFSRPQMVAPQMTTPQMTTTVVQR